MKKQIILFLLACTSYVLSCQNASISGTITRPSGEVVEGVSVQLTGSVETTDQTDASGMYSFMGLPLGGDYSVFPFKDDEVRQCVSVRDAVVIGKHITNQSLIESPYALLAADVDRTGSISIQDVVGVTDLVLGRNEGFNNNTSWRFIHRDQVFSNPTNPWQEDIRELVSINNLSSDEVVDFVAIKVGDPTDCVGDAPAPPFLTLIASDISGVPGEMVTVDISVKGFTDVSGLQFSLAWDEEMLSYEGVSNTDALNLSSGQYHQVQERLSVCWFSPTFGGMNLADETVIFSLTFKIVSRFGGNTPISFVEDPTPFEVVDGNCFPAGIQTNDGQVSIIDAPIFFQKLYGDVTANAPTRVKSFPNHNGLYVAGTSTINGQRYATFSKFNLFTGDLEWDFQVGEPSIIHDFEFVPDSEEFLLVGATEPFQQNGEAQDNESLLIKVDDNGQLIFGRKYQQRGREHFNRIIRQPVPENEGFPFYIVGTINPEAQPPFYPPPPSTADQVILINLDAFGTVDWARLYDYEGTAVPDEEFHRGILGLNQYGETSKEYSDILLMGNDSPTNDGILVKVDGGTGAVLQALKLPTGFDIYGAIGVRLRDIFICGTDFNRSKALIANFDWELNYESGLLFDEVPLFEDISLEFTSNGYNLYTTGQEITPTGADIHNYVYRTTYTFNGQAMHPDYGRRIDDGSTIQESPKLMSTLQSSQLYYADARQTVNGGFGDTDILVGSFDFEFSGACVVEKTPIVSPLEISPEVIEVATADISLPQPTVLRIFDLNYQCEETCVEAECDLTFQVGINDCGNVRFSAVHGTDANPIRYDWNVGCDPISESFEPNPILSFPLCGATQMVCLTVEYDDGTVCSYEEEVNIQGDTNPPLLFIGTNIQAIGALDESGNCSTFVNVPIPTVLESCGRVRLTNDYTEQIDASGIYPVGETMVTYTATDECGNSYSDQLRVEVACRNCGEAVITCFPGFIDPDDSDSGIKVESAVVGIVDIRNREGISPGTYLEDRSGDNIYHPSSWNYQNLGLVFGLAIDQSQNIYAASTTLFGCNINGQSAFGPSSRSRIYKIDAFDNISVLIEQGDYAPGGTTIPSDGAGFGNICYDPDHHQLFATNLHDGYIYRIDLMTGTVVDRFDPFQGDNPISDDNPDFVALGQRPWAIGYNPVDGKLYYSNWKEDRGHRSVDLQNEIWATDINELTGAIENNETLVIRLPDHLDTYLSDDNPPIYFNYSNPVSDIAFSEEGLMLIAERSVKDDCGDVTRPDGFYRWYAHQSRVLEYQYDGLNWRLSDGHGLLPFTDYAQDLKYRLGTNNSFNGATTSGGVDYGYGSFDPTIAGPESCDEFIWSTGDCLYCTGNCGSGYYGLQGLSRTGGDGCSGFFIDFDGDAGTQNKVQQGDVEIFKCITCPEPEPCNLTFDWEILDCNEVLFSAQADPELSVESYAWDVGCDGTIESTEEDALLKLNVCGGEMAVCLMITYTNGLSCAVEQLLSLPGDSIAPTIACPLSSTRKTDTGACQYSYELDFEINDDCSTDLSFTIGLSGATQGASDAFPLLLEVGTTSINLTVTDECGNAALPCQFDITVVDAEQPTVQCPATVIKEVLGCSAGATVEYPEAMGTDNCALEGIVYDIETGSFFPCGESFVTATANDIYGNSSNCSFTVVVNGCQSCAALAAATVSCGPEIGQYEFTLSAENFTNLADETAIVEVISPDGPITMTDNQLPELTGILFVEAPQNAEFQFEVSFEFPCQFGTIKCEDSITAKTPCCETIFLGEEVICAETNLHSISLDGDLPYLVEVDYIQWYVGENQCETFYLNQQSAGISDFTFSPQAFPDAEFLCIYAELVFLGGSPCQRLITEPVNIYLCDPPSGSIENANGPYCSDALPGAFAPLQYSSLDPSICEYTIQWYHQGELIPGANSNTYTPTNLTFLGGEDDCEYEHLFTARVKNVCGEKVCSTSIRIDNVDAPKGEIFLDPSETLPLCPGDAVTVRYDPKCIGPEEPNWNWTISEDGQNFIALEGAGSNNPLWNTNPLDVDTWYKVNKQNGVCREQEISFLVEVQKELSLSSFTAIADDSCDPAEVNLSVNFGPMPIMGCPVLVHWYKDGRLVHTSTTSSTEAQYTYAGPQLTGNYYAKIEDVCCGRQLQTDIKEVNDGLQVVLSAPCFRCKDEIAALEGVVLNNPTNSSCSYQWYRDDIPIPFANSLLLEVDEGDAVYTLEVTCGPCIQSVTYYLKQCGENLPVFCTCSRLEGDVSSGFMYEVVGDREYEFMPTSLLRSECDQVNWYWGEGEEMTTSVGREPVRHTFSNNAPTNVRMEVHRTEKEGATCTESYVMLVTSIAEEDEKARIVAYPNPTSSEINVTIESLDVSNGVLRLIDQKGSVVQYLSIKSGQARHYISLVGLPSATYILQLVDQGRIRWSEQIIKE